MRTAGAQDMSYVESNRRSLLPEIGFCEEKVRLLKDYLRASRHLVTLHCRHTSAVIKGDVNLSVFERLIHRANQWKDSGKYALLAHMSSHHC
jgi:hypothetical protein